MTDTPASGAPGPETPLAKARGELFAALMSEGTPLTAQALAERVGLDVRSVQSTLEPLVESGFVERHSGRPARVAAFSVKADRCAAMGVKILPTELIGVITDLRAKRLHDAQMPLLRNDPSAVVTAVVSLVTKLCGKAPEKAPNEVVGLGVELGGHIDGRSGDVLFSPNLAWDQSFELGRRLSEATGLNTVVENDVNALAIHEHLFGLGVGKRWFGVILAGHGIGCGLVLDGRLYHGKSGMAGEIGHIVIESGAGAQTCRCGNRGCLETVATTPAIAAACGVGTFGQAVAAVKRGDANARMAFQQAGDAMGRAVSMLLNILNLEMLVLDLPPALVQKGAAARTFWRSMDAALRKHQFSTAHDDCRIERRTLLEHFGAHGAASALLDRFARDRRTWAPVERSRLAELVVP